LSEADGGVGRVTWRKRKEEMVMEARGGEEGGRGQVADTGGDKK
jgi:hypothetical protein